MKLLAKEVGAEKSRSSGAKTNSVYSMAQDDEDYDDDELLAMEELYRELHPGEDGQSEIAESDLFDDGEVMEEHEAKELLSTMIAHKKKTFMQSLKTKKAKALARGYGQWRDKGSGGRGNGSGLSTAGYVKGGYYRMSLSEAKAKSRCAKCNQVGHWHRDPECPKNQGTSNNNKPKDVNYIEKKTISDSEEGLFCGLLEDPGRALRPDQAVLSETLKVATESFMSGNPDNSSSHDGHFWPILAWTSMEIFRTADRLNLPILCAIIRTMGMEVVLWVVMFLWVPVFLMILFLKMIGGNLNMMFIGVMKRNLRVLIFHLMTFVQRLTLDVSEWQSV